MKKFSAFLLAVIFILASPNIAQAATLREGSQGQPVVTLQTELNTIGDTVGPADGIFGPKTNAGVLKFQKDHGLQVDGIVGPKTEAALQRQTKTANIIADAKKYIGTPYLWGGTSPAGFDCSGFARYVLGKNGITLPRVSQDQAKVGAAVSYANLEPGDLMCFTMDENGVVSHVGIYIGNGQFIGSEARGVRIVTLDPWWVSRFVTARRIY